MMREHDDLGRMIVALDAPHDAIALVVEAFGAESRVCFVDGRLVYLLQRADELVEAGFALPAGREMAIVAGQHVGLHQLVVAQMCSQRRAPESNDAVVKSHGAVLPLPCAVCGWHGTDAP